MVALDAGDEATTDAEPTVAPSRVKTTVPVGGVDPEPGGVMAAVNCRLLPASGVVVEGVKTMLGVLCETVMDAAEDVEPV
jgi:hypothetical protein